MNMPKIFEQLGIKTEYGSVQSVDEMTVLPVLGDDLTKQIAAPEKLKFERTTSYGTMRWMNEDVDWPAVVPANAMVLTKQAAQDHAMASAGLVESGKSRDYENAMCVQETQVGYIKGAEDCDVLPLSLRMATLDVNFRASQDYDKLWPSIRDWLKGVPNVESGSAHIENFFRPYEASLNEFVAEFEPVNDQVGAFVFFLNTLVGFELMPTKAHWNKYWKWLVRGCYGAELLRLKLLGAIKKNRIDVPEGCRTLDDFRELSDGVQSNFMTIAGDLMITGRTRFYEIGDHRLDFAIANKPGGGDVVVDRNTGDTLYASLVIGN